MTSKEMFKSKAKPGFMFTNIAAIDAEPNWVEVPSVFGPQSDPNYGHGMLFGMPQAQFLAKQYK